MANVYAARKRLLVGDEWRQPGDLVPEAAGWRNLHSYLSSGAVVLVQTDDVQAYGMNQRIPTDTQLDPLTARVGATHHHQHAGWGQEVVPPEPPVTVTITSIEPNHGPTDGHTSVGINGTGLTGTTEVTFGGFPGQGITVYSDVQLSCSAISGGPVGVGDVVVTTPEGTATLPGGWTYDAPIARAITAIEPTSGPSGSTVVITGEGLQQPINALWVGIAVASYTVDSDTQITAVLGTGAVTGSPVNVEIYSSGPITRLSGAFTYTEAAAPAAPPTFTSLTPSSGPIGGSVSIVLAGTNFLAAQFSNEMGPEGTSNLYAPMDGSHIDMTIDLATMTDTSMTLTGDSTLYAGFPELLGAWSLYIRTSDPVVVADNNGYYWTQQSYTFTAPAGDDPGKAAPKVRVSRTTKSKEKS